MKNSISGSIQRGAAVLLMAILLGACGGSDEGTGDPKHVTVPRGASLSAVADSLDRRGIISSATLFGLYARMRGAESGIKAGTYGFREGAGWDRILEDLEAGRVLTDRLVIPEGWTIDRIAPGLARIVNQPADSIETMLFDSAAAARFDVPGPSLEGYLYPATYTFPVNAPLDSVVARIVARYRQAWTPERQARADSMGLSEREVVTLASIIEAEARLRDEMPTISAVYHNRLRRNYPLQADPTVQYALGEHQSRLLFAHIDSVADNPYNTYRRSGLPPGPIGSPSEAAIDAALAPADTDAFFFVARPDGSHVFTRTLTEHNRAVRESRRLRRAAEAAAVDTVEESMGQPAPAAPTTAQ